MTTISILKVFKKQNLTKNDIFLNVTFHIFLFDFFNAGWTENGWPSFQDG